MSGSQSTASAILATASRTRRADRSTFPARCRAKKSRSRACPGHPDRRHLLNVERPSAERIAPICPHFGVCGGCAMQHWQSASYRAWKRNLVVEALAPGRTRRAGRRTHRRPRRGPPPRRVPRAARHPRCARSGIFGGARPSHHFHRPLPGAGQEPRRRARGRMGDRGSARPGKKAARHCGDGDGRRPRCRRARLGPADGVFDHRVSPTPPRCRTWRG